MCNLGRRHLLASARRKAGNPSPCKARSQVQPNRPTDRGATLEVFVDCVDYGEDTITEIYRRASPGTVLLAMFCNYCRASNPDDSIYCSACGRNIKSSIKHKNEESVERAFRPTSSETLATPPLPPLSVEKTTVEESSAWDYAKMGDEELDQLREAYQKLRVPIRPELQSEIEERGRKHQVLETKDSRVPENRTDGSVRLDSDPIPNSDSAETCPHPQTAHESREIPVGTSRWVILGIFLAMAFALEASFLGLRQTSNEKIVESLTKLVLSSALAGWGVLLAISGRWLTLKRVLLIAGAFYAVGLSCLLLAFPRAPAGDRYLKALLEFQSIGQQIGQIEKREYHSPQDHIDALVQIEPLVRRWRQSMVEVQQSSSDLRLSPPPTEAQEGQFQQMLSLMNDGVSLKEQEVALAHEMQSLPQEEQQQFLDSRLVPLFRHELDLQNRALELQKKN